MTYREKLKKEHPSSVSVEFTGGCECCPHDWDYCDAKDDLCGKQTFNKHSNLKCAKCWDRTIPGTEKKIKKLPPDEKKKTLKATYAEFKDGHREEIFYCSGSDNSYPIQFATESGVYVYYENFNSDIYEIHHITRQPNKFRKYDDCFRKIVPSVDYNGLDVRLLAANDIHHIEFEVVEVDENTEIQSEC